MKKNLFFLYSFLLFVSCRQPFEPYRFEKTEAITFHEIKYPELIGLTGQLIKIGDRLLVSDFYGDTLVSVFNLKNGQVERKLVSVGNGPGELNAPLDLQIAGGNLYILCRPQFLLSHLPLAPIATGDSLPILQKDLQLPQKSDRFLPLSETQFVFSGMWDKRYAWLDRTQNDTIIEFGDYPDFWEEEHEIPSNAKAMFHQSFFAKHPTRNLFASCSPYVLEIFRFEMEHPAVPIRIFQKQLGEYAYDFTSGNFITAKAKAGSDPAIYEIACSEKFIYLIKGITSKNYEILIIDWTGQPVKLLTTDKQISCLTVDEKEGKGYACISDPEDKLVWFEIGE